MLPPFASNLLPLLRYYSTIQPFLTSVISNITSSILEPPSFEGNAAGATIPGRAGLASGIGPGAGPGAARPRPRPFSAGRPDSAPWGAHPGQHGPQKQHKQQQQQLFLFDYQAILIVLLTLYFSFRIVNVVRRIVMYWTILLVKTLFWGTVIGVLVLWMTSSLSSSSSSSGPSRHAQGLSDASRTFASSVMDVTSLIARWLQAGQSVPAAQSTGARNWWDGGAGRRGEL